MKKAKAPAEGDRIDLGGKLPQFDAFAWFAYRELVYDNLVWIRVADPKAEKLDDILYATKTQIHAYQLKWSNRQNPSPLSYNDFKNLFLECVSGWKALKVEFASENKKVIAHLLTNRPLSVHDVIKDGDMQVGSFSDFFQEVWKRLKIQQEIDLKWQPMLNLLREDSKLSKSDFYEFLEHFEFHPNYVHHEFKISNLSINKQAEDLIHLSRFLLEEVANKSKVVHYTYQELIKALGKEWQDRFKTTFNHELIFDRSSYQPITSTLKELDQKLEEFNNGYIFMVGGPGTGKSTLLTDWSKKRKERVIRYYAFDFTHPSSLLNDHERGEAVNLFFDIVFQLKQAKVQVEDVQPYKDLLYLKKVFEKQLEVLGNDYSSEGTKTVIIIDGLDHIAREYSRTNNSLLAHLPKPRSLPAGVYIILGSQSYDLDDLKQEIKTEVQQQNRTVKISALRKNDVFKYIDLGTLSGLLTEEQKQIIFEKSQGHPLYLSYLIPKLTLTENINETVNSLDAIDGDISTYYRKIWEPISKNNSLVELLGLVSRINGSVSTQFIREWQFENQTLSDFRKSAKLLFDESDAGWTFFHNSFRQFLIHNTSLDPITYEFDDTVNRKYHGRLAELYSKSVTERSWRQAYHLYMAGEYKKFLESTNPNEFIYQFLNFRPAEEIRRDIKLGIEVAKHHKDVYILIRYLFSLSELERRLFNITPTSFIKEFLELNEAAIAKSYIRSGKTLHCTESFALMTSRLFIEYDDKIEANIIFNIAEPEYVSEDGITVRDNHRYEEIRNTLEEWVKTASHFYSLTDLLSRINKVTFLTDKNERGHLEGESDLRLRLLVNLGESLIGLKKWNELELLLQEFDLSQKPDANDYFALLQGAIEECLIDSDTNRASRWLSFLLKQFPKEKAAPIARIYLADLIFKVTGDLELVKEWINDIPQPPLPKWNSLGYDGTLQPFMEKIKLNKLMNLCGIGVPITQAVPSAQQGSDEEVAVEFERMLCLITKLFCEGLQNTRSVVGNFKNRVIPIVQFYYKDVSHRNSYWYKLTQSKGEYFGFLVHAVSSLGQSELNELGDYLIDEFIQSSRYWITSDQREIIMSLLSWGFDPDKVKKHLTYLESFMLAGHDISSRIDECTAQAKAWIKLSEPILAKKWMQEAIKVSLGVGYRKDYQFSSWIQWLQKINNVEPEKAKERILWFLSQLRHIEETTEGSAYIYAAEEILQTTFQWNISAGRQQFEWQLDNALISFQDALLAFIHNSLEGATSLDELNKIIQLYTDVYLYISTDSSRKIVNSFLAKGFQLGGTNFLHDHLSRLVTAINIKSLEEVRFSLFSAIKDFGDTNGIIITDYVPDFKIPLNPERSSSSNSQNSLVLKENHESLDEKEVLERVTDFNSFKELIGLEDKMNSFFKWDKAIEKIAPHLSIQEIRELSEYSGLGRRESDFFAKLSEYALDLGNKELAHNLAEKAISLSNDYGWNKWYDGGTRITAFLALKKVDPKSATSKAFEFLAHDAVNYGDISSLCQQLEYILPCITLEYDISEVWKEVFDHLKRLMTNSTSLTNLPDLAKQEKPIPEDFIDLLLYLSKNPLNIISRNAQKLWASFITSQDNYSIKRLRELCRGQEESQEVFIHILMLIDVSGKEDVLNRYTDELISLSTSLNYQIRSYSTKILTRLRRDIPSPTKKKPPLVYSLFIEETLKPDFGIEADPLNPKLNLNDPEDLIKPYDGWINILEYKTGIKKINLIHRMIAIMKNIDDPDRWTPEFENKLKNHLQKINLKYAYPRPRAIAARRALMHLVTELFDSDMMNESDISELFEMHDHHVYFFDEVSKPNFISKLAGGEHSYLASDWIDRIAENKRLEDTLVEYEKGWFVIGEHTKVRSLDWGKPTETYMAQFGVKGVKSENQHYIFGSAFEILTKNYHNSSVRDRNIIIIRNHFFDQFDLKSYWIALNPVLARHLKWVPEHTKLFAWKKGDDNLMVQSIYWANGNIDMPSNHDSEVGQGWLIVASKEAIERIREVESDLVIQKKLKRYKWNEGRYEEKIFDKIIELK